MIGETPGQFQTSRGECVGECAVRFFVLDTAEKGLPSWARHCRPAAPLFTFFQFAPPGESTISMCRWICCGGNFRQPICGTFAPEAPTPEAKFTIRKKACSLTQQATLRHPAVNFRAP